MLILVEDVFGVFKQCLRIWEVSLKSSQDTLEDMYKIQLTKKSKKVSQVMLKLSKLHTILKLFLLEVNFSLNNKNFSTSLCTRMTQQLTTVKESTLDRNIDLLFIIKTKMSLEQLKRYLKISNKQDPIVDILNLFWPRYLLIFLF